MKQETWKPSLCPCKTPCFRFHRQAHLWREALATSTRGSAEGETQTLEQREPRSQHGHLIELTIFWQVTSFLKPSVSSSRKKETEKQSGKYNVTWWLAKGTGPTAGGEFRPRLQVWCGTRTSAASLWNGGSAGAADQRCWGGHSAGLGAGLLSPSVWSPPSTTLPHSVTTSKLFSFYVKYL